MKGGARRALPLRGDKVPMSSLKMVGHFTEVFHKDRETGFTRLDGMRA